ncbi:MAG: tyrosine-protein phosphatase [Acidimicrobiales bacterium]
MVHPLAAVRVVPETGQIVMRWEAEGDPDLPVTVAVGLAPDGSDHEVVGRAAAGAGFLSIPRPGLGRCFFTVSCSGRRVVVAERRMPFGSVLNFRDIGGYDAGPAGSAGTVKWGQVFRSDSLHRLTADHLEAFDELGIEVVYDLRSLEERELLPSVDIAVHLPIPSRSPEGDAHRLRTRRDGEQWLHEEYLYMLEHAAVAFGDLLARLSVPEGRPVLFHCAGGKDRTGLAAALLLSWLGVGRETVLDYYELTSSYAPPDRLGQVIEIFSLAGMTVDRHIG